MESFKGRLAAIFITPQRAEAMLPMAQVEAVAGEGLEGDRFQASGEGGKRSGKQVTLIEREAVEAACREYDLEFAPAATRRNLLTEGVPLNHLEGRTFRVGEVLLTGVELCEPCGHLEKLTLPGIRQSLIHRGGLRADILAGGTLHVGDVIEPVGTVGDDQENLDGDEP